MFYLDASVIVAAYTLEKHSDRVLSWLAGAGSADALAISEWTVTEVTSAFSIKLRTGQISIEGRNAALNDFGTMAAQALTTLPISAEHFRSATHFVKQYATGLRAGDALHLAVASANAASLCTLDRRMASAGETLGVSVLLL